MSKLIALTVIYGVLAAAPLAMGERDVRYVIWTGLAAGLTYLKGKLEEKPDLRAGR